MNYLNYSKKNIDIQYFYLYENEKLTNITYWDTDSLYSIKEDENFKNINSVYRRWYVGKIIFEKEEFKTIKVRFKLKNNLRDELNWMSYGFSNRNFSYDLSPSSNWGDGIVEDFNVNIDINYCNSHNLDKKVDGLEFTLLDSNIYTFSQKIFNLNNSDRINIQYDNSIIKNAEIIKKGVRCYPIKIDKIVASSNSDLTKFLIDNNPNTCWTGNKGDWLDIYFYNTIGFNWLNILNGNYSSLENFNNYSKIKKYMLQRNGDEIITLGENNFIKTEISEYKNVDDSLKSGFSQQFLFWDCGTETKEDVWHFRIYIQDIYEGEKTDSVAISEIYFM